MSYQITRHFEIDAGHRIQQHESKCRNLHGHRFGINITLQSDVLDGAGRAMDFASVKNIFGTWLDDHLDHGMILQDGDPWEALIKAYSSTPATETKLFTVDFPPTAENLAKYLFDEFTALLATTTFSVKLTRIIFFETPNCFSTYPPEGYGG